MRKPIQLKHTLVSIIGFVLLLSLPHISYGQFQGQWTPLNQVKKKEQPEKLCLQSRSDLEHIVKRQALLSETYSLKIQRNVLDSGMFFVFNNWPEITELYLEVPESAHSIPYFSNLLHVEHLILDFQGSWYAWLEELSKMPSLEKLTLIFREDPGQWDFLFYLKNVKNLHIYGPILPLSFSDMSDKLYYFPSLTELGLSIDYATDLPKNLNLIPQLKLLKLYDNLSRINQNNLAQHQPERFTIQGVSGNDQPISLGVLFYAEDFGLTSREHFYLQSIWSGKKVPYEQPMELWTGRQRKDLFLLAPKPVFKRHESIALFLEDLTPNAEIFKINSAENVVIHTENGCNFYLPSGSLLTGEGKTYSGKAFVSIRHLKDPLDMAFRGLDLKVGKFDNSPLFNAASHIEIEVSDGTFPLYLNNRFNFKLEVPVFDTLADCYYFDKESKAFIENEMYKKVFIESNEPSIPVRYDEWSRQQSAKHYYKTDERTLKERFQDQENYFLFDLNKKVEKYIPLGKFYVTKAYDWEKSAINNAKGITLKEGKGLIRIVKKSVKQTTKDKQIFFEISDKTGFFPELNSFKNCLFKYSDTLSSKEFNTSFTRNKRYADIQIIIEKDKGVERMVLLLKSEEGVVELKADKNLYASNGKILKEKSSARRYQNYKKQYGKREVLFNRFLEQRLNDYSLYYNKRQTEWEKKQRFKTVFVRQVGVYGFMHIAEKTEPQITCFFQYLDANGLPIDVKNVVLIDKKNGSVRNVKPGNITFNPESLTMILCSDYKGQVHYIEGDNLRTQGINDGSIYFLKLNSLPHPPRSVEEFKKYCKYEKLK